MSNRRRARVLLTVLMLSALVLITVDFRTNGDGGQGPLARLRRAATVVLGPVQDGVATILAPVGDVAGDVSDLFALHAENVRLRDRVAELTERRRSFEDLTRENERLRAMLDMRPRDAGEIVVARTISAASSNYEWAITIDVGTDQGVERDMVVLNGDGLVGRVIQVAPQASRVLLAIDPNFGAAARIADSGETGTVVGRGGEPLLFDPLTDPDIEVERGDEVVTSSYAGGVFPAGIPIGVVADPGNDESRLSREIAVQPYANFTRLDHVMVILTAPVGEIPTAES